MTWFETSEDPAHEGVQVIGKDQVLASSIFGTESVTFGPLPPVVYGPRPPVVFGPEPPPGIPQRQARWPAPPGQITPGKPTPGDVSGSLQADGPFADDSAPQVPEIPLNPATEYVTYAHKQALTTRLPDETIRRAYETEQEADTLPIFLYDVLVLPGSLAAKIKRSVQKTIKSVTPAILHDHHSHVHAVTHGPCLVMSPTPGDHVHGMLIFTTSRTQRWAIRDHYINNCVRRKVRVELEVAVYKPENRRTDDMVLDKQGRCLERREMWALAYVESNPVESDYLPRWKAPEGWNIADYILGRWLSSEQQGVDIKKESIGADYDADKEDAKRARRDIEGDDGLPEGFKW